MTQMSNIFSNRNVPSTSDDQPRATAIVCNVLGVSWTILTNSSKGTSSWLVLWFMLGCIWLMKGNFSSQMKLYIPVHLYTDLHVSSFLFKADNVMIPYDFLRNLHCLMTLLLLPPVFISLPSLHIFLISLLSDHMHHAISYSVTWQWSLFTFLISEFVPDYVFTSEDLEFGASSEREHVIFVIFGLYTQHDLFYFHTFSSKICDYICF